MKHAHTCNKPAGYNFNNCIHLYMTSTALRYSENPTLGPSNLLFQISVSLQLKCKFFNSPSLFAVHFFPR